MIRSLQKNGTLELLRETAFVSTKAAAAASAKTPSTSWWHSAHASGKQSLFVFALVLVFPAPLQSVIHEWRHVWRVYFATMVSLFFFLTPVTEVLTFPPCFTRQRAKCLQSLWWPGQCFSFDVLFYLASSFKGGLERPVIKFWSLAGDSSSTYETRDVAESWGLFSPSSSFSFSQFRYGDELGDFSLAPHWFHFPRLGIGARVGVFFP